MTYICDDKINTNILRGEGKLVIGVVVFEHRNDGRAIKAYVLVNPQLRVEGGTALLWKEQLLRRMVNNQGEYVFPAITTLYQGLENDFKSTDDKEEALEKLATTKQ
jgi:hypothetical protein